MNYEAINRFTREKEMGKEKRTFGTGWKFQLVPQGPIWDLGKKKVGHRARVEPCPRSPNYRALPLRY